MERINSKSDKLISMDMIIALFIPAVISIYYYGARAAMIIAVSIRSRLKTISGQMFLVLSFIINRIMDVIAKIKNNPDTIGGK